MDRQVPKKDWYQKKIRKNLTETEKKKLRKALTIEEEKLFAEIRRRIRKRKVEKTADAKRLGYRLYFDLSSGWKTSVRGYKHIFVAVDESGRWQFRIPLKKKTDVYLALRKVQEQMAEIAETCTYETQPKRRQDGTVQIQHIECDGDGMFRSHTVEGFENMTSKQQREAETSTNKRLRGFESWCKTELGAITVTNTASRQHESAGVAEAAVKTAQKQTNKVLLSSPLKLGYW